MRLNRFTGADNQNNPLDVGLKGLIVAKNIDIDRQGRIATRKGFTAVFNGAITAISGNLFLSENKLYRINDSGEVELLEAITGEHTSLTSVEIAGNTYFSTGAYNGVIEGSAVREMGLYIPSINSVLGVGGLLSGRYLITATSVSPDGRESGAAEVELVVLPENSKLTISADVPAGHTANIYMSGRDGEELYLVANSITATIDNPAQLLDSNEPLDRQYKSAMPVATIFDEFRGHLLAVSDNYLFYSEALDYELCDFLNNTYPFESPITMLVPTEYGVYISTQQEILYASGESPDTWVFRSVHSMPALKNTGKRINLNDLGDGSAGYGALFVTNDGSICVGSPDGSVQNLTHKKFKLNTNNPLTAVITKHKYLVATV